MLVAVVSPLASVFHNGTPLCLKSRASAVVCAVVGSYTEVPAAGKLLCMRTFERVGCGVVFCNSAVTGVFMSGM
jgi:hypothetical protein